MFILVLNKIPSLMFYRFQISIERCHFKHGSEARTIIFFAISRTLIEDIMKGNVGGPI